MVQTIKKLFDHQISLLVMALLLSLGLYWPSMNGTPIFDDYHFIFNHNVIIGDFPLLTIFKDFAWPVSVILEKLLYHFFQTNYFVFHLINVLLHALNGFLLFKLLGKFNFPFPRFIALLFLIHPSNVISVSWMVQLKTVICFTFGIMSCLFLLKSSDKKYFYLLAWIFFALSVLSKAASMPLALLLAFYIWKTREKKELLWVIPFFIISAYSAYKVISSEMTTVASKQIHSKTFVAEEKSGKVEERPKIEYLPAPQETVEKNPTATHNEQVFTALQKLSFVLKTNNYYFWQVLLPLESYPVKGQALKLVGITDLIHICFFIALAFLVWKSPFLYALLGGYLMILPFLGFTDAPYMTLTWVSEQHLYLVLPFFLCFWLGLLSKVKSKYVVLIPILFLIFFSVQSFKAVSYYKDDISFYTSSLKADPYNLPIVHNLVNAYLRQNRLPEALNVTGTILEAAHGKPWISSNKYFPYIQTLHGKMVREALKEP